MKKSSGPSRYWKTQLPVDYIDTSLVINTWETVIADLSGGKPAKLLYIIVEQTNNGTTDEDIEFEITINGTAYTFSGTMTSGTRYYAFMEENLSAGDFNPVLSSAVRGVNFSPGAETATPFIAESVSLIRVRQTTDVDLTSAQIEVNIVWDRLEP